MGKAIASLMLCAALGALAQTTYPPLLGDFKAAGTGAVRRPMAKKVGDVVSVKDFGGDPNASATTNETAITNAIAVTGNFGTILFPCPGTYATNTHGTVQCNGGGSSCSGDINASCSQVTALHLSSPVPAAQGGLGATQPTCSAGQHVTCNGTSCSCSTDVGSFPTRKTATDASSYLYWSMDESSLPLANGVVAQGTNGNFDLNGNVAFLFGTPAMISNGVYSTINAGTRAGAQASLSTALSPAYPISVWYWVKPAGTAAGNCDGIDGVLKAYRAPGSWTAPFASVLLGVVGGCTISAGVTVTGTLHQLSPSGGPYLVPGTWNLIWMSYDGANIVAGINNYPASSVAQTGAIDYNGNVGRWNVGQDVDNATVWRGMIDEVHVDTVARTTGYFQTIWRTATGQGGP